MRRLRYLLIAVALVVVAVVLWWRHSPEDGFTVLPAEGGSASAEVLERGRVLARLANCHACHTVRGSEPFAGGRAIPTQFGTFYSPNITPDAETGIGRWSERDFWRALHLGLSRDGSFLYPAFPYTNFTKITQSDAHALWEYLKTVKPVSRRAPSHTLEFPYRYRSLLRVWRALYFRPGVSEPGNRGEYLANAVAHCDLCHVARNDVLGWYAPALDKPAEAGMQHMSTENIVELLHNGRTTSAATLGPMAEVVYESLQHAPRADIEAMASYLKGLPETPVSNPVAQTLTPTMKAMLDRGQALYKDRCATCHGDKGEGKPPAALALANNRSVTMNPALNVIRVVLYGGYPPGTAGNPQPFGMPPFAQDLSDQDVADVVSYIRTSWGNSGSFVSPDAVLRQRTGPLW